MPEQDEPAAARTASPFASWRIDHAGIRVPDFEQAVAWYTSVLDFRLLRSASVGDLTFGFISPAARDGFSFEVMAGPGVADRPAYADMQESYSLAGWHHIGIRVHDVDEAITELRRRGVRIVKEPRDAAALALRIAFFADPWGNILEVIAPVGESETGFREESTPQNGSKRLT